jgi:hypothetical protein
MVSRPDRKGPCGNMLNAVQERVANTHELLDEKDCETVWTCPFSTQLEKLRKLPWTYLIEAKKAHNYERYATMLGLLEEPLTLIFDKVDLARTIVRVEDQDTREEGRREFIRFARKWFHFFDSVEVLK